MIAMVGNLGLCAAIVAAIWSLGVCAAAKARRNPAWLAASRAGLAGAALSFLVAAGALSAALAGGDFRLTYVAAHSQHALPLCYRLASFWSGQEGSLLLWGTLAAGVGALVARRRHDDEPGEWATHAVLAAISLAFAVLLFFVVPPFTLRTAPDDGHGLSPQLRHWAMAIHPPLLFTGYALGAAPFAIMCGALICGRPDDRWAVRARPWAIGSWIALTLGIAIGAWWAYAELGWGGYWAWDPVENASLLPWLTGTALVHAISVQRHRGLLRGWTAGLAAATFALSIFGTWVTRSGVLHSIHSFDASRLSGWLIALLAIVVAGSVALLVWRRSSTVVSVDAPSPGSRETVTLWGLVLLCAMAMVVVFGTLVPVVSAVITGRSLSVEQTFYSRLFVPPALILAALMAFSPFLTYARATRIDEGTRWAALGAGLGIAAVLPTAGLSMVAMFSGAVAGAVILAALGALAQSVRSLVTQGGFSIGAAILRVLDGNHRRYGGQLAHIGVALVIIGVTGSSLFSRETTATVHRGGTLEVAGRTLRFDGLTQRPGENFTVVEADLALLSGDAEIELHPQRRFDDMTLEAGASVAIRSRLSGDLYVALVGWEAGGRTAAIQARLIPLTIWIWIGAGTMAAGGMFALLPRLTRPDRAEDWAPVAAPSRRAPAADTGSLPC